MTLGPIPDRLAPYVERGDVPGIVALVSRRGETRVEALGARALGGAPMGRDTIFRIASMTKPITAAATMLLVEDGTLHLDEPVERLLPELANRRVLKRLDGPLDDTVPAKRAITVFDLLTFRMGFGLILAPPDGYPILKAVRDLGIVGFGPPDPAAPHDPDEWIRRLATLPLMRQPGEMWMYNTGAYVLGVLIARASRKPFETFLRERIFEPLGMTDTAFSVPAAKLDRLATAYWRNGGTGALTVVDGVQDSKWSRPPAFPDGGAGLVSTVDDYLAFGQMLLHKGQLGSKHVLSRQSVDAMTTDYLTPEQKTGSEPILGTRGWGFGVAVAPRHRDPAGPGGFGWDGGYGTSWATDPDAGLVGILMTQRLWDSPSGPPVYHDFWTSVYNASDN